MLAFRHMQGAALLRQGKSKSGVPSLEITSDWNELSVADLLKNMQAQMGGPWVQARNFAVITGVHAGIAAACRRIRKKDDTYTA